MTLVEGEYLMVVQLIKKIRKLNRNYVLLFISKFSNYIKQNVIQCHLNCNMEYDV